MRLHALYEAMSGSVDSKTAYRTMSPETDNSGGLETVLIQTIQV